MSMRTTFGNITPLSLDDEIELCSKISEGKEFLGKENPTKQEKELAQQALKSSHELVRAYSPLIESMAKEKFANAGTYSGGLEDFIGEAYIVALRCALTFNPHASKGRTIRFSSYAPRAISTSLQRMSMRSRTMVSVPTTVMSKARSWSHSKFELLSKGIDASDEEVSAISGVDSKQSDIRSVLRLGMDTPIDEIFPPSITDSPQVEDIRRMFTELVFAVRNVFGEQDAEIAERVLGFYDGSIAKNAFDISSATNMPRNESEKLMKRFRAMIIHPSIRCLIAEQLRPKT